MAQVDGEVLIDSKIDTSGIEKGAKNIKSIADNVAKFAKKMTEGLKKSAKGSDDFATSSEELSSKIKAQEKDLSALKQRYIDLALAGQTGGDEAKNLGNKIQSLSADLQKNKARLADAENAADQFASQMDDAGDATKKAGDSAEKSKSSFGNFAKTLGKGFVAGVKALAAGAISITAAFLATGEASQEFMEDMGKLETAFTTSGHSVETAKSVYDDFVGLLGETDQAVEASNHLAKLTQNTQELSDWGTIAAGVYATFGDSLPLEGLTEAANETARVGQVVGPLADALNWAGVNEDEFNKKLKACNSEQERASLITETLMGLYKEAGDTYKNVNSDLIEARQANSNMASAMAEVGKLAMPITTAFKNMGANILNDLIPALTAVKDGFMAVFNGDTGGAEQLGAAISGLLSNIASQAAAMLPTIAKVGINIVTTLAAGLINGLPQLAAQGAQLLYSLADGIRQNLPQLLPVALETITSFSGSIRESIGTLFDAGLAVIMAIGQGIISSIPSLIESIPQIVTNIAGIINDNAPKLLTTGLTLLKQLAVGLIQAIPVLIANIPSIIQAIVSVFTAFNWLSLGKQAITGIKNGIVSMVEAVRSAGTNVLNAIINALKNLPSKLLTLGRNGISSLANGVRGAAGLAKSAITTIINSIMSLLRAVPGKVVSIGRNIVMGIANGIRNAARAVVNALGNVVSNAINAVKIKLGIASPSKVMRDEVGRWIPEGIAVGISKYTNSATEAMDKMKNAIMQLFDTDNFQLPNIASGKILPDFTTGYPSIVRRAYNQESDDTEKTGTGGSINQYTQNFYSPKALSRREIRRETKNIVRRIQTA